MEKNIANFGNFYFLSRNSMITCPSKCDDVASLPSQGTFLLQFHRSRQQQRAIETCYPW